MTACIPPSQRLGLGPMVSRKSFKRETWTKRKLRQRSYQFDSSLRPICPWAFGIWRPGREAPSSRRAAAERSGCCKARISAPTNKQEVGPALWQPHADREQPWSSNDWRGRTWSLAYASLAVSDSQNGTTWGAHHGNVVSDALPSLHAGETLLLTAKSLPVPGRRGAAAQQRPSGTGGVSLRTFP